MANKTFNLSRMSKLFQPTTGLLDTGESKISKSYKVCILSKL